MISGDGKWKLHLPHNYRTLVRPGHDGQAGEYREARIEFSLFDMEGDPHETTNVADQYPQVTERLKRFAEMHRKKFYHEEE